MSQPEQKNKTEDGCGLPDTRETTQIARNNRKRTERDQGDGSKKRHKIDEDSIKFQNGDCHCESNLTSSLSLSLGNAGVLTTEKNVLTNQSESSIKETNISVVSSDISRDISTALGLASPSKAKDIHEMFASMNESLNACNVIPSTGTNLLHVRRTSFSDKQSSFEEGDMRMLSPSERSRSLSDPGITPLSSEDLAHLEEIAKQSNIGQTNTPLIDVDENSIHSGADLDFQINIVNSHGALMTHQALELTNTGTEFDPHVVEKDVLDTSTSRESQINPASDPNLNSTNDAEEVLRELDESQQAIQSSIESISLTPDQDTTQFLLNTEDGKQQIVQLKMSDVYQVVHLIDSNSTVQNLSLPPGFAIQDGYLVLPVTTCGTVEDGSESSTEPPLTVQKITQKDGTVINLPPSSCGKLFCCIEEGCGRFFEKQSKLRIHVMGHNGIRPFKCNVVGCHWAFRTNFQLKRHINSHEKRKDFVCDIEDCGHRFTTIYNLQAHRKLHLRPLEFACTVADCTEKFDTQRKLDLHLKTHNNAEKQYKCPHPGCNRVFFSSNCMGSHARWHAQTNVDLTCEYCAKEFTKASRLKNHIRVHTGDKPFVCKVCDKAFTTNSKLGRHEKIHTNERPFPCTWEGCGKRFPRAEHLKGHMVTHTKEKAFSCPIEGCNSKFSAKSSMHVHIKKHSLEKDKKDLQYCCPLEGCNKAYSTKISLRGHLLKHYQGSERPQIQNEECDVYPVFFSAAGELSSSASHVNDATSTVITNTVSSAAAVGVNQEATFINPADYLLREQTSTAATFPSDVITHHVGNNVVTQLVVIPQTSNEIVTSPQAIIECPSFSVANDVASTSTITSEPVGGGSARTDYTSNHILSERAKNRRQLLKHRLGFNIEDSTKQKDPIMSGPTLNPHEMLTSRAITFRDPETGTTYVQTQLLQDDPPNPEIYSEEDQTPLSATDLTASVLQENQKSDSSHENTPAVDFTGTTINLQDLA